MNDIPPQSFFFSTDLLPERDRFAAFCEGMFRTMLMLDIARTDNEPFSGSIQTLKIGDVQLCTVATTAADCFRTSSLVRDGTDDLFAVLPHEGALYTTQGAEVRQIMPGTFAICDATEIGGLRVKSRGSYTALQIKRHHLNHARVPIDRFAGLHSEPGRVSARLLESYLKEVANEDLSINPAARQLFGKHLIDLVGLALGAQGEARLAMEQAGARAARKKSIDQEVAHRLNDSSLTAATVAAVIGITPRYVHSLFEESGQTFSQYVLDLRLDNVHAALMDPLWAQLTIAAIAFAHGFSDISHFNRSFRRRFGRVPSDVRHIAHRPKCERDDQDR